jgi:hypothetical protein
MGALLQLFSNPAALYRQLARTLARLCSVVLFHLFYIVPHLFRYYLAKSYNIGLRGCAWDCVVVRGVWF